MFTRAFRGSTRRLAPAAVVVLAACGGGGDGNGSTPGPVDFVVLASATNSGVREASNLAVRDATSWQTLWTRHTLLTIPPPALPTVSFTSDEVIAVFAGAKPNTCYSISVQRVTDSATERTVQVSIPAVPVTAVCGQEVIAPAQFVRVPRSTLPVVFDVRN